MALPIAILQNDWPDLPSRNYMCDGELGFLLTMLDQRQPKRMVEFGVNQGITARAVLNNIESIEYYLGVDVPFEHKMQISGQQSEVPSKPGHLVDTDPRFDLFIRFNGMPDQVIVGELFDVAFIDGDHSYAGVITDYRMARRMVRKGGLILFHDYNNRSVDVTKALEDLHQNENRNLFNINGTMLVYEQL